MHVSKHTCYIAFAVFTSSLKLFGCLGPLNLSSFPDKNHIVLQSTKATPTESRWTADCLKDCFSIITLATFFPLFLRRIDFASPACVCFGRRRNIWWIVMSDLSDSFSGARRSECLTALLLLTSLVFFHRVSWNASSCKPTPSLNLLAMPRQWKMTTRLALWVHGSCLNDHCLDLNVKTESRGRETDWWKLHSDQIYII